MMYYILFFVLFGTATCQDVPAAIMQDITNIFYNLPVAFQNCDNTVVDRSSLIYTLYNQTNPQTGTILTDSNLGALNPTDRVIFIFHGWLQSGDAGGIVQMKDAYLNKGPANVIVLDWSVYSNNIYGASFCAVPPIGKITGDLIYNWGIDVNQITINGFSLGAQIAAYAGQQVQTRTGGAKIVRINAMDAAGPGYLGLPINERLDPTDAGFVQAIHCSNSQFGYTPLYGTADFQVNCASGTTCGAIQIGCPLNPTTSTTNQFDITALLPYFFCNHLRCFTYFIESIVTGNFVGVKCSSCSFFGINQCTSLPGTPMGEDCPSTAYGEYFISTNPAPKFAKGDAGKGML